MSRISRRTMLGTSAAALAAAAINGVSSPTARAEESLDLQWARATLAKMDLNEKVNQLFIHQVFGTDPHGTDPRNQELYGVGSPVEMIQKFQPGGIILTPETGTFDGSKDHIMGWNRTLDETVKSIGTGVPLHLITRQEPYQLARHHRLPELHSARRHRRGHKQLLGVLAGVRSGTQSTRVHRLPRCPGRHRI